MHCLKRFAIFKNKPNFLSEQLSITQKYRTFVTTTNEAVKHLEQRLDRSHQIGIVENKVRINIFIETSSQLKAIQTMQFSLRFTVT